MFRAITTLLLAAAMLPANDELFDAARRGDLAQVKAALDKGVPVDATWRYGQTALLIAASRGHADVVKLLLDRGAKADVKDTFYGMTAMQLAAQKDAGEVVRLLLDKGATGADDLLPSVAGEGKLATVKTLVARGGLKPETMTRALSVAEAGKHAQVAEVLKAAGAKPRETVAVDPKLLASYAGVYIGRSGDVRVEVREGKLVVLLPGQELDLVALDSKSFEVAKYPDMKMVFGETGIDLVQSGKTVDTLARKGENAK